MSLLLCGAFHLTCPFLLTYLLSIVICKLRTTQHMLSFRMSLGLLYQQPSLFSIPQESKFSPQPSLVIFLTVDPGFRTPSITWYLFFFSDYGRLMAIGPLILSEVKEEHFKKGSLDEIGLRLSLYRGSHVVGEIMVCWIAMARANALCFAEEVEDYTEIDRSLNGSSGSCA